MADEPKQVWCDYHENFHGADLVEQFQSHADRLGLSTKKLCPIAAVMEHSAKAVTEPTYVVHNRSCAQLKQLKWPTGIDLMLTRLPATERDGYSRGLVGLVANEAFYHMHPHGLAFVVIQSYKEDKARAHEVINEFRLAGFSFIETIIWVKSQYTPTQGGKRLNNVFDYILFFARGDGYHLNRKAIAPLRRRISRDDTESACAGNVWIIDSADKNELPEELIETIFALTNLLPGSTVVDPFMGDGDVLRMALKNNLSFWGCEADRKGYSRAIESIQIHTQGKTDATDPGKS